MQDVPVLDRVQHGPLRELIMAQLLGQIVSGRLAPGSRLLEARLAAELGTSRVPVREALLELSREGWVDLRARQGAWVHVPTLGEIDDISNVRAALEAESIRVATQRATQEQIDELRKLVAVGAALVRAADTAGAAQANSEFHRAITEISGNELLIRLVGSLELRVQWHMGQVVIFRGMASWDEHAVIVNALAAGDPERAVEAMRAHIEKTRSAFHSHPDVTHAGMSTVKEGQA